MAPAAKKSKTAAADAGAAKGSLMKLFAAQGAKVPTPAEQPSTAAPAADTTAASVVAPEASTPVRSATQAPQVTPAAAGAPVEDSGAAAAPAATGTAGKPGLSPEQLLRIEENRRKALERQQAKKRALDEGDCSSPPTSKSPAASPQKPIVEDAPAAANAAAAKPFAALSKAVGKAKAKAGSAKPKGKTKAEPKAAASPFAALGPNGSPAKSSQGGANITDQTPEKTALPAQEKRASPAPQGVPASSAGAATMSAAEAAATGKFDRHRVDAWGQYAAVYGVRLRHLRGSVLEEARALWGGVIAPDGFRQEISGYRHGGVGAREVVIVGVLFKDLKSRPNVIEQFRANPLCSRLVANDSAHGDDPEPGSLCSDDDALFLEDASMRLRLTVAPEQLSGLCTGLVAAVKGVATSEGGFNVTSMVFSRLPPPPALQCGPSDDGQQGPFMAMVSGLAPPNPGSAGALSEAYDKLIEFLAKNSEGKVQGLMICGGALCTRSSVGEKMTKEALVAADDLLARLAGVVPVQVMPGCADPTNLSLPQMPLHPHLFRRARACPKGALRCVSNPYSGVVDKFGLSLLGHSGQPVQDILRCTRGTTPLSALRMCLEALHLAPTAPDTLTTPPFEGEDPFVIKEVPHVLFSGGHARAEHEWQMAPRGMGAAAGTQCVCVPAFYAQPAVVLVNLRDPRDVRVQAFGAGVGCGDGRPVATCSGEAASGDTTMSDASGATAAVSA